MTTDSAPRGITTGDGQVDAYLALLGSPWPQSVASAVVSAIRSAGPFDEAIKWGHPYFGLGDRAVVKIFVARRWIDVFFYQGAHLTDTASLLRAGGSTAMRLLQIARDGAVPPELAALVREAVAISNSR